MHETEAGTAPGRWAAALPWPTTVAMLLAPLGIVIASLAIPSGVDRLPTSDRLAREVLQKVAAHPFETRLGFLSFAAGMLLLLPALTALRTVGGAGLWRGGTESRTAALLIAVPLVVLIAPPFSPATASIGLALEAGFVLVLVTPRSRVRAQVPASTTPGRRPAS